MARKYWIWTGPSTKASKQELKEKYTKLKSRGITGVFLEHGIFEPECEAIKAAGLEMHSWMWTTNRGDQWIRDHHPEWYQVSRVGQELLRQAALRRLLPMGLAGEPSSPGLSGFESPRVSFKPSGRRCAFGLRKVSGRDLAEGALEEVRPGPNGRVARLRF